jgi:hypothetical protein
MNARTLVEWLQRTLGRLARPAPAPEAPRSGGAGASGTWDTMPAPDRRPKGIRNHNPGNLRVGKSPWRGQVGGDASGFCVFADPVLGLRALALLLRIYQHRHGIRTVTAIIGRWAPPEENDTVAYIRSVRSAMGVHALQHLDLDDAAHLRPLTLAIVRHENGMQPYPPPMVDQAIALALESTP